MSGLGELRDSQQLIPHLSNASTFTPSSSLKGRVRTDRSGAAMRYGVRVRSINERRIGPRLVALDKPGGVPASRRPARLRKASARLCRCIWDLVSGRSKSAEKTARGAGSVRKTVHAGPQAPWLEKRQSETGSTTHGRKMRPAPPSFGEMNRYLHAFGRWSFCRMGRRAFFSGSR